MEIEQKKNKLLLLIGKRNIYCCFSFFQKRLLCKLKREFWEFFTSLRILHFSSLSKQLSCPADIFLVYVCHRTLNITFLETRRLLQMRKQIHFEFKYIQFHNLKPFIISLSWKLQIHVAFRHTSQFNILLKITSFIEESFRKVSVLIVWSSRKRVGLPLKKEKIY